jgi:hypothetical protein
MPRGANSTKRAIELSRHYLIHGHEHPAGGKQRNLVRILRDVCVPFVENMFTNMTSTSDHRCVLLGVNSMYPFKRRWVGSEMRKLTPERSAEEMLDERLKSLRSLRVPDSCVVLQEVGMINESKFAHGAILGRSCHEA